LQAGKNIASSEIYNSKSKEHQYPCYGGNGRRGYVSTYNRTGHFCIIGRQGALCGNVNFANGTFYATEHAVVVDVYSNVDVSWSGIFLSALNLNQYATATAQPGLAVANINKVLIPLPPIGEQKRIVAKLEKLLPLIDEFSAAQEQLDKLNKELPEALKKSILQEAIQGKLVPQNPNDEPAQKLLERIALARHSERSEESSKRSKKTSKDQSSHIYRENGVWYEQIGTATPKDITDEIPFEIPETWAWCRWGELSDSIQYGYNAPALDSGRIKMVRISDIHDNKIEWNKVPYCQIKEIEISTYLLQKNDILFARTGGTVGKSYLVGEVPTEAVYAGYLIRTRYNSELLSPLYLKFFMESSLYWGQLHEGTIATAQPNCNGKTLGKMLLPLPPLAEQKRIVAKLEQLFKVL
jgi:type I restriction enzyme S subunit